MTTTTGLSGGARKKRPRNGAGTCWIMALFDAEILYSVLKLGENAHHPAIMRALECATGTTFHRQNFRRIVENFVAQGYLSEHACRIRTRTRPATKRFELTPEGKELIQAYREHALAFTNRLSELF